MRRLRRWSCGWLLGHRFMLLVHVVRRETVLEIMKSEARPGTVVPTVAGRVESLTSLPVVPDQMVLAVDPDQCQGRNICSS